MRCISVYTKDFEVFSDIYEQILDLNLADHEEVEIEGITVSDAGEVSDDYVDKMRLRPEVAVMRIKKREVIVLQHGDVFEMLFPSLVAAEQAG